MLLVAAPTAFVDVWQRRKSRSFHSEAGMGLVGAAFADANRVPSSMRSPLAINSASPPADAAAQATKIDIHDRITGFMMSSKQGARNASFARLTRLDSQLALGRVRVSALALHLASRLRAVAHALSFNPCAYRLH